MTTFASERDLASLALLSALADERIAADHGELAQTAPSVSAWSAEHHLAHLSLANELCLRNLASLAKGSGMLVVEGGEPRPGAREMLAAGRIVRGAAQSPRMVRPPDRVERALLLEWQASNRVAIERLLGEPGAVRATGLKIPHQLLGALDAVEWVRFAAVHTRHHLEIAYEVLGAVDPSIELTVLPELERVAASR